MPLGEVIGEVLLRGAFELIFYTLAYYTGAVALRLLTLGQLRLAPLSSIEQVNRGKNRWTDWSIWLTRDRQGRLLKAEAVCLTGLLLWLAVGAGLYFTFCGDPNKHGQAADPLESGSLPKRVRSPVQSTPGPSTMIDKEIETIFAGQEAEDGDVDVDGVLEAFDRLKSTATESDLPALIAAIQSPRNNFWTRELLAEPICRLGGSDCLEPLLEAAQLGLDEGHDNDGFDTFLIELARAEPDKCRTKFEEPLARPNFKHHKKAMWLLEFCK